MVDSIRSAFLGWQCRIRQMSMRDHEGRPQPGMRPRITDGNGGEIAAAVTVVLVQDEPEESRDMFRHIVKRTHDPKERRDAAIKLLSSTHYQYPVDFSDQVTAVFSAASLLASTLLARSSCTLEYEQFGQSYVVPCLISALDKATLSWQATYWHNHMFNPNIPGDITVLAFAPDWEAASMNPVPD